MDNNKEYRDKKVLLLAISIFAFLLTAFLLCLPFGTVAYAEGSVNLNPEGDRAERVFLDWQKASTGGITRETKILAYAFAGETLYFGSDIADSWIDENDVCLSAPTGVDIVLRTPDGSVETYDVDIARGTGYIGTRQLELSGPKIAGKTEGYTPLSYTATQDGVYEFSFHSRRGNVTSGTGNNPTSTLASADTWDAGYNTVGAWDITVCGTDGKVTTGRVYAKYIAMNMGSQTAALNADVVVVTDDGYIYQTTFNQMQPFGFVLFANSRGLVNVGNNSVSLYDSVRTAPYSGSNATQLENLETDYGVTFQNPMAADTTLDQTYNIFFAVPDTDLYDVMIPRAYMPEKAKYLRFVGSGENETYVGQGGYFEFSITNATSAALTIDLTPIGGGVVTISNSVVPGVNRLWWDGNDANGNTVPAGVYDLSKFKVQLYTKSGEYHFPLLDVESNRHGISCQRINKVYQPQINEQTGAVRDVDVTDQYASSVYTLYYNNTAIYDGAVVVPGFLPSEASNKNHWIAASREDADHLAGMDSSTGAMKFGNTAGDFTALDIWTYSPMLDPVMLDDTKNITIKEGSITAIRGFVFYDNDPSDGAFGIKKSDQSLSDVTVNLLKNGSPFLDEMGQSVTTVTNAYGFYYFNNLPYSADAEDVYTVQVVRPQPFYTLTTADTGGTEEQRITVGGAGFALPLVEAVDVGYHYDLAEKNISVKKTWTTSALFDPARPSSVTIVLDSEYTDSEGALHRGPSYTAVLSADNSWKHIYDAFPGSVDGHTLRYFVASETYEAEGVTYTYDAVTGEYSPANAPYVTSVEQKDYSYNQVMQEVTNSRNTGSIEIYKYNADRTKLLPGAVFELYEGSKTAPQSATLVDTQETNADGMAYFDNLADGKRYFIKEASPPDQYVLTQEYYGDYTIDKSTAATNGYVVTVTNEAATQCGLKVVKKVDGVYEGAQVRIGVQYASTADFADAVSLPEQTVTVLGGKTQYTCNFMNALPVGSYVKVTETVLTEKTVDVQGADYPVGTKVPVYRVDAARSYGWDGTEASAKVSYDTTKDAVIMQMTDSQKVYEVVLQNDLQTAQLWFAKEWQDQNGTAAVAPEGVSEVGAKLQRRLETDPDTDENYKDVPGLDAITAADGEAAWVARVDGETGLLYKNTDGTKYVYRVRETEELQGYDASYVTGDASVAYSTQNPHMTVINRSGVVPPAPSGDLTPVGRKVLTDNTGSGMTLADGMFSFVIRDDATDAVVSTGTNRADGSIVFSTIPYTQEGTYQYTVREITAQQGGMTCDTQSYPLMVEVSEQGGALVAEPTYPEGGIVFRNAYDDPADIAAMLNASKGLTGKTLKAGMFAFVVKDEAGNVVSVGTNDAQGGVMLGELRYTLAQAGTEGTAYVYTVCETTGEDTDMQYDDTEYRAVVTVTITDETAGTLDVSVEYPDGAPMFRNVYTPPPEPTPTAAPTATESPQPTPTATVSGTATPEPQPTTAPTPVPSDPGGERKAPRTDDSTQMWLWDFILLAAGAAVILFYAKIRKGRKWIK